MFDGPSRADGPAPERRGSAIQPRTPKTGFFSFGDDSKASKMKDEQSFKKFDSIMKQKGGPVKPSNGRVDTDIQEDDDDEVNMEEVQQKLKSLTKRNISNAAQTGVKSLFTGVKNLFS